MSCLKRPRYCRSACEIRAGGAEVGLGLPAARKELGRRPRARFERAPLLDKSSLGPLDHGLKRLALGLVRRQPLAQRLLALEQLILPSPEPGDALIRHRALAKSG